MLELRYPGIKPFTDQQQNVFFGRDKEIEDLSRLVKFEQVVVLYGKSGLGKSSLLNAGILPKIKEERQFFPIPIRFTAWTKDSEQTPLSIASLKIKEGLSGSRANFLERISSTDKSIWFSLKARQIAEKQNRFILVFDQFEELFSYPEKAINALKRSLAEVMTSNIPERVLQRIDLLSASNEGFLSDEEEDLLDDQMDVKLLFTIRSDRLHLLNYLSDHLPQILSNNYELKPLQPEDAKDALVKPAALEGNFEVPPFQYSPDAVDEIIHYLKDEENRVESIQLQLLCQSFESKVKKEGLRLLTNENIGDLEDIIANYYQTKIETIEDPQEELAARRLIEEGLVLEGDEHNMRLSMHEGQIKGFFGVGNQLLQHLVDNHLLRAEPSPRGGYTYELCHDTLIAPVLDAKKARLTEEKKIKEETERLRLEEEEKERIERQAEKERLEEERKKRRRNAYLAFAGIGLSSIALVASGIAFVQYKRAQSETDLARIQEERAILAARKAEEEKLRADLTALEADSLRRVAEGFLNVALEEKNRAVDAQRRAIEAESIARKNASEAEAARQREVEKGNELAQANVDLQNKQQQLQEKIDELATAMAEVERQRTAKEEAERKLKEEEYAKQSKLAEIESITKELQKEDKSPEEYNRRGNLYIDIEEYQKAIDDYTQAINMNMRELHIPYHNRALANYHLGNFDATIADYQKSLEINPTYGDCYNGLGVTYRALGDNAKAIEYYKLAIENNMSQSHLAYRNIGLSYQSLGNTEEAVKNFEKAIEVNPNYLEPYDNLANIYSTQFNDVPRAIDYYSRIIAIDPAFINAYFYRGRLHNQLGDYDKGIEDLSFVLELYPKHSSSLYYRAEAYRSKMLYNEAISDYNQYIEIEPGYPDAYNLRGNVYLDAGNYDAAIKDYYKTIELGIPELYVPYLNLGLAYNKKMDYPKAIESFEKALEYNPTYGRAFNGLGAVYAGMGEYQKAIESYNKALEANTEDIHLVYRNRGLSEESLKNYDAAIADYLKAAQEKPDYADAYYSLGALYHYELKDLAKAEEFYTKAIEVNPDYFNGYYYRGILYSAQVQTQKAIQDFTQAIRIRPGQGDLYNRRGNELVDLKSYTQAIQDYERAIELGMDEIEVPYANLGLCYENLGDYSSSVYYYGLSLSKKPDYSYSLLRRGIVNNILGRYSDAVKDFSVYLELNPNEANVYNRRGNAYLNNNQNEQAIADYDKAIELNMPDLYIAYRNKGIATQNLGAYDEAILFYKKSLELEPSYTILYNDIGLAYYYKGEYANALINYNLAIEKGAEDLHYVYTNRGLIHELINQTDDAISDYQQAIGYNPNYATAHYDLAYLYDKLGQFQNAITVYTDYIRLRPEDAVGYNNRGYLYAKLGQYDKALIDLNTSIDLDENPNTLDSRAYAYLKQGNLDAAEADINQAIAMLPGNGFFYSTKALIYAKRGDMNAFYQNIETAIKSPTPFKLHEEAEKEPLYAPYLDNPRFKALIEQSRNK